MKTFSIIYWINLSWTSITLLLYTTLVYGLLAQFVLGIIQLLSSLILLVYWKNIWEHDKKHVYYYWLIVIAFFTSMGIISSFNNLDDSLIIAGMIGLPMAIAFYFTYILYRLNIGFKKNKVDNQLVT